MTRIATLLFAVIFILGGCGGDDTAGNPAPDASPGSAANPSASHFQTSFSILSALSSRLRSSHLTLDQWEIPRILRNLVFSRTVSMRALARESLTSRYDHPRI